MNKKNLFIVLVVYNELINDIDFINRYHADDRFHLIVIDNSTNKDISKRNKKESEKLTLKYFSENKNLGLSKAYNLGISKIDSTVNNWVMTLDQDTFISENYIQNVLNSICKHPEYLVKTGMIYFGDRIGSPTIINSREVVSSDGIYQKIDAINSGLVLNRRLLEDIGGYNEKLFLDMVDYLIFYNIRLFGVQDVEVLPGEIRQEFSGETRSTYENEKHRFAIYKKDFWEYSKIANKSKVNSLFILFRRRLNLFIKYKIRK